MNDQIAVLTAELRHGAFWYNNCYKANLNGEYLRNGTSSDVDNQRGVVWFTWEFWKYLLKRVEMKIKPN